MVKALGNSFWLFLDESILFLQLADLEIKKQVIQIHLSLDSNLCQPGFKMPSYQAYKTVLWGPEITPKDS